MNPVELLPGTKEILQRIAQSTNEHMSRRARLILAYSSGMQTSQAAQAAGLSSGRARYWKREYGIMGMAIFPVEQDERGVEATREKKPIEVDTSQEDVTTGRKKRKGRKQGTKKPNQIEYPELTFPKPVKEIGVLPGDTLAAAGKKVMLAQFAAMIWHESGTREGVNIEALHDMRVATRRLRSAFGVFGDAYLKKPTKPYLNGLRQTGKLLGGVRDLDVFMEKANGYLETLPAVNRTGLDPLLLAWQGQLDAARSRLINHFDTVSYEEFKRNFNYFIQSPGYAERDMPVQAPMPTRVCEIAPCLIYECLAKVRAYESTVQSASIAQLHALRIEFKRLRYILEFFTEVLGGEAKQVIEQIKKLQDHLGDLHDADVACQILNGFLENWDRGQIGLQLIEIKNPEPIVNYLGYQYAERHRLIVTFPEAWANFMDSNTMREIAMAISVL